MGALRRFNVPDLVKQHRLRAYVETGAGHGDSLFHAAALVPEFEELWACEIEPILAVTALGRLAADQRVRVLRSDSARFLGAVMPGMPPALIYLDAHFPGGADYGLQEDYPGPQARDHLRLPLATELEMIWAKRRAGKDVIIIDDLRLYETGDWKSGPLPEGIADPQPNGADWIRRMFADTHLSRTLTEDEGYLVLAPRG